MLHRNTIDDTVYDLLIKFTSSDYLRQFALAGGTALALQFGHRKSIDIDLFSFENANLPEISLLLENEFDDITIRRTSPVFIFCYINSVKCDFVNHSSYKLIKPCFTFEGIRMYSAEDIAAMKLNAICGRGSRKDFYDIYTLLQHYSLQDLLNFYDLKFQGDNSWMALRSLQYFEDADNQEDPELLYAYPKWEDVKKTLTETVNRFDFNA